MNIETNISQKNIKIFESVLDTYRINLLKQIYDDYLKHIDNLSFNDFKNSILIKNIYKKKIIKKNKIADDIVRCKAYIWKKGEKQQCKKRHIDNTHYCKLHTENRYYGEIN